jgi:hypothetical protein
VEPRRGDYGEDLGGGIAFDTDPNSPQHRPNVLDAIEDTVIEVLRNETTMAVTHLKIVPHIN